MLPSPAHVTIPRLHIDRDADRFVEEFYVHEKPVIFPKAVQTDGTALESCSRLSARIAADDRKTERTMWYDVREGVLDHICQTPAVVSRVMNAEGAFLRENCVRIWFNSRYHVSPWHYDGHSLHVFNLQLCGRKRWMIVDPDTPLCPIPFNNICLRQNESLAGKRHYEFTLEEGDLLFLPRYWFHRVVSEGELNVNVNWVLMSKAKAVDSRIARREAELMRFKDVFYPLMPRKSRWLVDNYAGCGRVAVRHLTRDVPPAAVMARIGKEIMTVPLFILCLPAQIANLFAARRSKQALRELIAAHSSPTRSEAHQ
jgi:hypothetical protein